MPVKMVTDGIEISIQMEPMKNLYFDLSETYQKTKDKRPGYENITVAYSPNMLGYGKIMYCLNNDMTFSLTGNYVGEMETYWDETIKNPDGSFGNRIGEKTPDYFIFGANFRVDNLFYKGLYLNVRGSNLLNREIHFPTFTNNQWAVKGTIDYGISVLFTLGVKF